MGESLVHLLLNRAWNGQPLRLKASPLLISTNHLLFGSNPTRSQSLPVRAFMPVISTAVAQPGAILHRTQMVILSKTGHQPLVCNLLHDPKQPDSFHSGRWNTTTNPDLAFVNLDGPAPSRIILDHFPKSQHRPSLIISESPISSIPSKPVKEVEFPQG